jgi:iron complex transport system substrate-binding protein
MAMQNKFIDYFPKRIICLTEETTETLYLLEEQDRIAGISVYAVRPPQARKEKPRVSAFIDAKIDRIMELKPDLVIGYSDIQANIAQVLISNGIAVWVNNYRSIQGIYSMIAQLGSMVGQSEKAYRVIESFRLKLSRIECENADHPLKPKVYFEEWFDPLITGSLWVSELIKIAGGIDIFETKAAFPLAKDRIVEDENNLVALDPDIIIASWCGKKFNKDKLLKRSGWENIRAIQHDFVFEIDSSIILQPGPAAILEGIDEISRILDLWRNRI